jgi:dTDP-glucose 4,6-dehydratase
LYVDDHSTALWAILKKGRLGEVYNIGGENEWRNIDLLKQLIKVVSKARKLNEEAIEKNITFVKDRPGHDLRYAIDCSKITKELHWKPSFDFEKGLEKTVGWYLKNEEWCKQIKSGEYLNWMQRNYINR